MFAGGGVVLLCTRAVRSPAPLELPVYTEDDTHARSRCESREKRAARGAQDPPDDGRAATTTTMTDNKRKKGKRDDRGEGEDGEEFGFDGDEDLLPTPSIRKQALPSTSPYFQTPLGRVRKKNVVYSSDMTPRTHALEVRMMQMAREIQSLTTRLEAVQDQLDEAKAEWSALRKFREGCDA